MHAGFSLMTCLFCFSQNILYLDLIAFNYFPCVAWNTASYWIYSGCIAIKFSKCLTIKLMGASVSLSIDAGVELINISTFNGWLAFGVIVAFVSFVVFLTSLRQLVSVMHLAFRCF